MNPTPRRNCRIVTGDKCSPRRTMCTHIWVLLLQVLGCLDPIGVVIADPRSAGRITYAAPDSPSAHGWDAQPRTTRW